MVYDYIKKPLFEIKVNNEKRNNKALLNFNF